MTAEPEPTAPDEVRTEPWKVAVVPPEPPGGDLSFECPRCREQVGQATYGPCPRCRSELRATVGGERRDVEVEYVPKMNVTPNAVALKD